MFAALYDPLTSGAEAAGLATWRQELLAPLAGTVLEIGAGTGRNLPHYPPAVTRLVLTEPDAAMRSRLCRAMTAVAAPPPEVEVLDAPADRLPLPDASVDAVVSTLVLCSVDRPSAALAEIKRVLRPGGRLALVEHVAADAASSTAGWQRRAEPVWRRLAGGCRLTRPTGATLIEAGFTTDEVAADHLPGAAAVLKPALRGWARPSP